MRSGPARSRPISKCATKCWSQAQGQLDEIAAGLARALSDQTVDGTPVTAGAQSGFDIDIAGLQNGNTHQYHLYRQRDRRAAHAHAGAGRRSGRLAASRTAATADPNDKVIGSIFPAACAAVVSQLSAALATTGLQFSNPVGHDAARSSTTARPTRSTSIRSRPSRATRDVARRRHCRTAVLPRRQHALYRRDHVERAAESSASPAASPSTPACWRIPRGSSSTRPRRRRRRRRDAAELHLRSAQQCVADISRRDPGSARRARRSAARCRPSCARWSASRATPRDAADNLSRARTWSFNALQQRFNNAAGVNVDQEMANLLDLQNAYAANARVLSAIKDMFDTLLQDVREDMSVTGIGSQSTPDGAVAGRHAPAARRPAAPARHRHEVRHLCRHGPRPRLCRRAAGAGVRACAASTIRSPHVGVRLDLAQSALGRLADIGHSVKASALIRRSSVDSSGPTTVDRRPPTRSSTKFSACSTPRPATAIFFPASAPISRRSRPSTTSSMATARVPASSRWSPSAIRPISAPAGSAGWWYRRRPRPSVGLAEDAVSPFGFKLAGVNLDRSATPP